MLTKPVTQKSDLRSSTQLSAAEVEAFLGAGLEPVSPRWSERVSAIIYRPVTMPHLVSAIGAASIIGIIFGIL
jgi:hypothetical protein